MPYIDVFVTAWRPRFDQCSQRWGSPISTTRFCMQIGACQLITVLAKTSCLRLTVLFKILHIIVVPRSRFICFPSFMLIVLCLNDTVAQLDFHFRVSLNLNFIPI